MSVNLEIKSCEDCPSLDSGGAWWEEYFCTREDAPRGPDGKRICFNAELGIPDWCPLKE